jgi:polysaccharide pyruvyl transferase WcaK-like protein
MSATSADKLAETVQLMSGGRFAYFRDSRSLALAKKLGCSAPVMEFGPDGAFAVDLANDQAALEFMKAQDLVEGKFLCCIPRLRYSPYWKMKEGSPFDEKKHARNEAMKEHDISPLRDAIVRIIKETDMKVLLCPEDKSQVELCKTELLDKLPAEVKSRVVWRSTYWLTDEAVSTYRRSAGLFGLEMHSPIMCVGNGIPAIVCRFEEQTSKGFMWQDIGLGDWLFDMDQEDQRARVAETALAMAKDPAAAKAKTATARALVEKRQLETMNALRRELGLAV